MANTPSEHQSDTQSTQHIPLEPLDTIDDAPVALVDEEDGTFTPLNDTEAGTTEALDPAQKRLAHDCHRS